MILKLCNFHVAYRHFFPISENTNWYLDSDLLKEPRFPIIFHSIEGKTLKKGKETR